MDCKRVTVSTVVAALASLTLGLASPIQAQTNKKATPAASSAGAAVVDYAGQYKTVCAACHGVNGRSDMAGVPVLAGNSSLYVITQLFLFREGRRKNEVMVAMAKPMKDADLKGFSDYIGTLPPVAPPPPAKPVDNAKMTQALAKAQEYKCVVCHGSDLSGSGPQGIPRIGGQKEEYLSATLHEFKAGTRPGYTRAMTEALSQVPVEDLDLLAYFAANINSK